MRWEQPTPTVPTSLNPTLSLENKRSNIVRLGSVSKVAEIEISAPKESGKISIYERASR